MYLIFINYDDVVAVVLAEYVVIFNYIVFFIGVKRYLIFGIRCFNIVLIVISVVVLCVDVVGDVTSLAYVICIVCIY